MLRKSRLVLHILALSICLATMAHAGDPVVRRTRDFDGDGKTDLGVRSGPLPNISRFRLSTGTTQTIGAMGVPDFIEVFSGNRSSFAYYESFIFGLPGWGFRFNDAYNNHGFSTVNFGVESDTPTVGDFDGNGLADFSIFRNGEWWVLNNPQETYYATVWGKSGDIPIVADYDGDFIDDFAVFRPSDQTWWILRSSDLDYRSYKFGIEGDIRVPADYDGDNAEEVAVFRPSDGTWYIFSESTGFKAIRFGLAGDIPAPGDYDGDGVIDLGVFRPSEGVWYLLKSTEGFDAIQFGSPGNTPYLEKRYRS